MLDLSYTNERGSILQFCAICVDPSDQSILLSDGLTVRRIKNGLQRLLPLDIFSAQDSLGCVYYSHHLNDCRCHECNRGI
jgi:hypothetical protein